MILLISGTTHTGKTKLAQILLEKYYIPYFSIDHLKMGLIRSKYTDLNVEQDDQLQEYMWPIVKEMIKTAIENNQNLIIEGDYIPFNWKDDFEENYLKEIKYCCLIMSENYILTHKEEIINYANVVEKRMDDTIDFDLLIQENTQNLEMCQKYNHPYILIDKEYIVDMELVQS